MPLFGNIRSLTAIIKFKFNWARRNPPADGKEITWARRHSDAIIAFSRFALRKNLMVVAYYILRLLFMTIRVQAVNEYVAIEHLTAGKKAIAVLWHQRIIAVFRFAARFGHYKPSVMVSQSRDGDLIAAVFSRIHFRPIRGSSSKGGKEALNAIVEDLKINPVAIHILDGPRGPRGVIKPGVIVMAQQSGLPIVPIYISVNRAWVLNSWDRCLVPKPFSRITIRFGEFTTVPAEMDHETFEEARLKLERQMLENQRQDDSRFGWKDLI
jgi:lysophospholipid acyltransferase (LPLAT)-like uncharacterized protein